MNRDNYHAGDSLNREPERGYTCNPSITGTRNNMETPPAPTQYVGLFPRTLQSIEEDLKAIVAHNEDNVSRLLMQMKAGNKTGEQFKELQHEFRSQIESLQKEDQTRFEVRLEICKIASGYALRLTQLIGEVITTIF